MQLIIVISKTESYFDGALLIKDACASLQLNCDIRYIEDINFDESSALVAQSECIIYFLTNADDIPKCVSHFERSIKNTVINRDSLISSKTKFDIQSRLRLAGIHVPDSIIVTDEGLFESVLQNLRLPLYIKSQKQVGTVIRIEKEKEFYDNIAGRSTEDFYFEESVNLEEFCLKKIYYVDGHVELKNENFIVTDDLRIVFKNISDALNLDVYSADIFFSNESSTYLCIDVNPAPALFHSTKARINFAKYVSGKLAAT